MITQNIHSYIIKTTSTYWTKRVYTYVADSITNRHIFYSKKIQKKRKKRKMPNLFSLIETCFLLFIIVWNVLLERKPIFATVCSFHLNLLYLELEYIQQTHLYIQKHCISSQSSIFENEVCVCMFKTAVWIYIWAFAVTT